MPTQNPTVFIIEDDDGIRLSLERGLSRRGFEVLAFASAMAFLDAYDENQAGCIVVDHKMPEMTGLELQEHLAKIGCSMPIIFMSGNGDTSISERAMKAGAVGFLDKPFRNSALVELINASVEPVAAAQDWNMR